MHALAGLAARIASQVVTAGSCFFDDPDKISLSDCLSTLCQQMNMSIFTQLGWLLNFVCFRGWGHSCRRLFREKLLETKKMKHRDRFRIVEASKWNQPKQGGHLHSHLICCSALFPVLCVLSISSTAMKRYIRRFRELALSWVQSS